MLRPRTEGAKYLMVSDLPPTFADVSAPGLWAEARLAMAINPIAYFNAVFMMSFS